MPELPEVETVRQGLLPVCCGNTIQDVVVRERRLRWPVSENLDLILKNQFIQDIDRRGKYLLFKLSHGVLLVHLGMSGVLQICNKDVPLKKHDHIDICLADGFVLRFNDPRRFGTVLYSSDDIQSHCLLQHLGPEPFDALFNPECIFSNTRNKKTPIKSWLMNAKNVVGVGNIYASEILFLANIHPLIHAEKITRYDSIILYKMIQHVLKKAIEAGGTTLKDFRNANGKPGYFEQQLYVYGRENEDCLWCGYPLTAFKLSGRQTVCCDNCQVV